MNFFSVTLYLFVGKKSVNNKHLFFFFTVDSDIYGRPYCLSGYFLYKYVKNGRANNFIPHKISIIDF